jgi:hypothetical protein
MSFCLHDSCPEDACVDQTALSSTQGSVPFGKSCSCGHDSCDECRGFSTATTSSSASVAALAANRSSDTFDIAKTYEQLRQKLKYEPFEVQRKVPVSNADEERLLDEFGLTREGVQSMRDTLLSDLDNASWSNRLPQTKHHLQGVIREIFFRDTLYGCNLHCPKQQSFGHAAVVDGGNCLKGSDYTTECLSVKLLLELDTYFKEQSSLIVGRDIKSTSFFEREICLTPDCKFQRCSPYKPMEVQDIADAINFYLRVCNDFHANTFFWSGGGTTTNAGSIMELVNASDYPTITVHKTPLYHIQFLAKTLPFTDDSEDNRKRMLQKVIMLSNDFDVHQEKTTGQRPQTSLLDFMCDSPHFPAVAQEKDAALYQIWFDAELENEMTQLNKFLPDYCMKADGDSLVFSSEANHDHRVIRYASNNSDRIMDFLATALPPVSLASRELITIHHLRRYLSKQSAEKQRDTYGEGYSAEFFRRGSHPKSDKKPATKFCNFEGCTEQAVNGGVCIEHGATKKARKSCNSEGCAKQAVNGGCALSMEQRRSVATVKDALIKL